jgi:ankyrin repeat protein
MYILADADMNHLIKNHPSASRCLELEVERCGCPLFAAIANGNHHATHACLNALESARNFQNPLRISDQRAQARYPSKHDFAYSTDRGPFFSAVALGGEALVTHLASLGCFEPDVTDKEGRTPLCWATQYGWVNVVRLLLLNTKPPFIDIKDKDGHSALYTAVERKDRSIIELLLKADANVNAQGGVHGNPLHVAARGGTVEIVTMLLDAGADVNSKSDFYGNALHAATYGGHKKVVTLLLDRGADIKAQGPWGTVYMAALRHGHEDVHAILRKFQAQKQAGWA